MIKIVLGVELSIMSFFTTSCGDAAKKLIILGGFLLLLLLALFFLHVAAVSLCELLPFLGAHEAFCTLLLGGVLYMYPSMLRRTFGILYVVHVFSLPGFSLKYVLFLFWVIWEFTVIVGVGGVGVGVGVGN